MPTTRGAALGSPEGAALAQRSSASGPARMPSLPSSRLPSSALTSSPTCRKASQSRTVRRPPGGTTSGSRSQKTHREQAGAAQKKRFTVSVSDTLKPLMGKSPMVRW